MTDQALHKAQTFKHNPFRLETLETYVWYAHENTVDADCPLPGWYFMTNLPGGWEEISGERPIGVYDSQSEAQEAADDEIRFYIAG
jgi:hypothetical protein